MIYEMLVGGRVKRSPGIQSIFSCCKCNCWRKIVC